MTLMFVALTNRNYKLFSSALGSEERQDIIDELNDIESKNVINSLKEKTNEIMKIIEVITSISNETNMLALNAAIESARAGESSLSVCKTTNEVNLKMNETQELTKTVSENSANIVSIVEEIKNISAKNLDELKDVLKVSEDELDYMDKLTELVSSIKNMSESLEKISSNSILK